MSFLSRDILARIFNGDPRAIGAFEELDEYLNDTITTRVAELLASAANASGRLTSLESLDSQPRSDILSNISNLAGAGAIELVTGTTVAIRGIDTTDDACLISRGEADARYEPLGGGGGGGGAWGSITGTLSDQTDLQTALDAKLDESAVSAFALTILDDVDAATMRATLGLGYFATGTDAANLTGTVAAARIADGSLSIAKTSGLQAALDAKLSIYAAGGGWAGYTFTDLNGLLVNDPVSGNKGGYIADWADAGVLYGENSTASKWFQYGGFDGAGRIVIDGSAAYTFTQTPYVGTTPMVVSGAVTTSGLTMATSRVLGRTTASTGAVEEMNAAQLTAFLNAATAALQGAMSAQDKTRLDAMATPYRTITSSSGSHTASRVAGTYGFAQGQPLAISGTGTLYALDSLYIDPADYPAIGSLAAKLRIRCAVACNDVAPTGNYTIGLHPLTRPATSGGAGLAIYTIGAAVAGSTVTLTTPAADSHNNLVGSDFALPAAGFYVVGMVSTATVAASAHMHFSSLLQLHWA